MDRKKLQIEMVQPVGSSNKPRGIQQGGRREVDGSTHSLWQQMGHDCQVISRQNRQRSEEPLACHHGQETQTQGGPNQSTNP